MSMYLRVLGKSYPMNTNMTGFKWFSKIIASAMPLFNASALEGLSNLNTAYVNRYMILYLRQLSRKLF